MPARRAFRTARPETWSSFRGSRGQAPGPERDLLQAVGRDLGHGLAAVLCVLDLRLYVFGGGFAAALDLLEPGLREGVAERSFGDRSGSIRLERAGLGPSAGWIGAARPLLET